VTGRFASAWGRLAELPLAVESIDLAMMRRRVSPSFERWTTVIRLSGAGHEGLGEDVNWEPDENRAFASFGRTLPVRGRHTLGGFAELVAGLDIFPSPPRQEVYPLYRRWALESAALDLALRQAATSLDRALGIAPAPVRFVASPGLGSPPTVEPVLRRLEHDPTLRFKLDASPAWDDSLVADLAATGAVDVVDFKGAYRGTSVDQPPDPALYARVARGLPGAWLEDPAWTDATRDALAPWLDRVTWDAPIHGVDDVVALDREPRTLNVKPSRLGSIAELFRLYEHCSERGIALYGGGQFELGPGRGQALYLASLFHPDAPNDLAPRRHHGTDPAPGLPRSPLEARPEAIGFRMPDE
jgi:hypothetical protein